MTRAIGLAAALATVGSAVGVSSVLATDYAWKSPVNGNASVPTNWNPTGTPDSTSLVTLPAFSNQSYTVTHDVAWTIDDLKAYGYTTAHLNGFGLIVNSGGDFYDYSILRISNTTYDPTGTLALHDSAGLRLQNGTVAGGVNTSAGSSIIGYGTIDDDLSSNDGLIRAEDGQLTIGLASNDHDGGTLSAAVGGTLYIRNAHDILNRDTITLAGGTLKGYQYAIFTLVNGDSNLTGHTLSGRGTVDRYYVRNTSINGGAGTISPTGGTLTLNHGFLNNEHWGIINLASGGTLNLPNSAWTNYATISMTGGGITGQTMSQNNASGFTVTAGTGNTVQNVTFNSGATISGGATLTITGTGTLNGATISEAGAGGSFNVGTNGLVQGRGAIYPDVSVAGTLAANTSGQTMTLHGALNVQSGRAAFAGSGVLVVNGTTTNSGSVYANAGNVYVNGAITNSGNLYATGGGANVQCASSVYNRGTVYATSGGTVGISGTIKAGTLETGDFLAASTAGSVNLVTATVESGVRNTFTANTGGTLVLWSNPNTGSLYQVEALRPRGGTFMIASGQTLTNAAGKRIIGFGSLLDAGKVLTNNGEVTAHGGLLSVAADSVTNTGLMSADGSGQLNVTAALENLGGTVRSEDGASVSLAGVTNTGVIEVMNGGGVGSIFVGGKASGAGTYSLKEGQIVFRGGLTMPDGGRIVDGGLPSRIDVSFNLAKQGSATGFAAEHVDMRFYSILGMPIVSQIDWQAEDRGPTVQGLDDNLAIGQLTFGDGVGSPASDPFLLTPETTIYCYGLTIQSDADVDLGGRTIYYLRAGLSHNGVPGRGFENLGNYTNGEIIEINGGTADFDTDGDVDLSDFSVFQGCFNGPNRPPTRPNCEPADFDTDRDVDLTDFAVFQGCFNGPNRPPKPGCP